MSAATIRLRSGDGATGPRRSSARMTASAHELTRAGSTAMPGPAIAERRRVGLPGTVGGRRLPEERSLSLRLSPARRGPRHPHWSAGYSRTKPDHLCRRTPIRPFCFTGHGLFTGPCEAFAADTDAVTHRLAVVQNEIKEGVPGIDDHGAGRLVAGVVDHLPNKCFGTVSSFWWFDQRRRGRNWSRSLR